jgi:hypothetical protein
MRELVQTSGLGIGTEFINLLLSLYGSRLFFLHLEDGNVELVGIA